MPRSTIVTLIVLAMFGTITDRANAQTADLFVNDSCGNDAWSGISSVCAAPNGPKKTIQAAVVAASTDDIVEVADGVYAPVQINKAITVRSANGLANCIIDANAVGRGVRINGISSGLVTLQGFTIQDGNTVGIGVGGGVYVEVPAVIKDCRITDNDAGLNNQAYFGGGLACASGASPLLVQNCTIDSNEGARGAGVWSSSNNAKFINCTIRENLSSKMGGGIYCSGGTTVLMGA